MKRVLWPLTFLGVAVGLMGVFQNCGPQQFEALSNQQAEVASFAAEKVDQLECSARPRSVVQTEARPAFAKIEATPGKVFEITVNVDHSFAIEELNRTNPRRTPDGGAGRPRALGGFAYIEVQGRIYRSVVRRGFVRFGEQKTVEAEQILGPPVVPTGEVCGRVITAPFSTTEFFPDDGCNDPAIASAAVPFSCNGTSCELNPSSTLDCGGGAPAAGAPPAPTAGDVGRVANLSRGCNAVPSSLDVVERCDGILPAVCNDPNHIAVFGRGNKDLSCETMRPERLRTISPVFFNNKDGLSRRDALFELTRNNSGQTRLDNFAFFRSFYKDVTGQDFPGGYGAKALPYFLCVIDKSNEDFQRWIADNDSRFVFNGRFAEHKNKAARFAARNEGYRGIFGCDNLACFKNGDCDERGICIEGKDCRSYGLRNGVPRCFGNLNARVCPGPALNQ